MKNNNGNMTKGRFGAIVEAYGANPDRWPAAERASAKVFLGKHPDAKKLVAMAGGLDATLDSAPQPKPADIAFLKRLATIPHAKQPLGRDPSTKTTFGEFLRGLFPARSFVPQGIALAGILGIWLGVSANLQPEPAAIQLDASQYLFGNPDLKKDLGEFQ